MHLSDEHINSFQMLYKKRFGKDISKEDARNKGIKLLRLMFLTYRPMTQEQFEAVKARQQQLFKKIAQ